MVVGLWIVSCGVLSGGVVGPNAPIELGAIGSEWAEVCSGLSEGDRVIVN